MRRIQSKKHNIGTYEVSKVSLSCFDDKSYILNDGANMLAFFSQRLPKARRCSKRFSQMIINKKRFSKIIMNKKRFSQIRRDPNK